jgi:Ca2+-binding RTX toxin-like protein
MVKHIISSNTTAGLLIDADGGEWIINQGVTVDNLGGQTINDGNGGYMDFSFVDFIVKGTLTNTADHLLLDNGGDGMTFTVTSTGKVVGTLRTFGDDTEILNNGRMVDGGVLFGGGAFHLENNGKLVDAGGGVIALQEKASGVIINGADGLIDGSSGAITTMAGYEGHVTIKNLGTLRGDGTYKAIDLNDFAASDKLVNSGVITGEVELGGGGDTLVNSGKITGSVALGDGNDTADLRGGTLVTGVAGGKGNDTYYVDQADVKIFEVDGNGNDTVYSSVTFALDHDFERLRGLGTADIKLTGNELDNSLSGNKGANILKGMAGSDFLNGAQGNDILAGGADADTFYFAIGGDVDHITDFDVNGADMDLVELAFLPGIKTFTDLQEVMVVKNGNTVMDFGGGDKLILDGVDMADLTADHFKIFSNIILP